MQHSSENRSYIGTPPIVKMKENSCSVVEKILIHISKGQIKSRL